MRVANAKSASLVELVEAGAPVEVVALAIARDARPKLDMDAYLRALDEMARPLEAGAGGDPRAQAAHLAAHVYEVLRFKGNETDYYDPRNSWLDQVIDRRLGIPITLAVILIAIGRRAGIRVDGIAFPGHFLARVGGEEGVYVDPFHLGRILEADALARLAERALGDASLLRADVLAPVGIKAIAVRMLANLKGIHEQRHDHAQALVVCDRMVDLGAPPQARRDRGLHALALGSHATAAEDLAAYLEGNPGAPDADEIQAALARARAKPGRGLA